LDMPPKVVIGPSLTGRDAVFALMSDIFHEASKRRYTASGQAQKDDNGTKLISLVLASWYNETILPLPLQNLNPDGDSVVRNPRECTPEDLHLFVGHTLKRMERKKTCEISIRILVRSWEDEHSPWGRQEEEHFMLCEMLIASDIARRSLSGVSGRSLTIVLLDHWFRHDFKRHIQMIQRVFWNVRVRKPRAPDRVLFRIPNL